MSEFAYVGAELDLFQRATNWKSYYAAHLRRFITGDVVEVGAGIGATSRFLCDGRQKSWTCLEPDRGLAERLDASLAAAPLPVPARGVIGTLDDLPPGETFDTALYIDVLEHIEDDRSELSRAARRMRPGGHVIGLSPAHQWLFSPFDRAIGHFRRYSRETLTAAAPQDLELVRAFYLDSVGMLASMANKTLLKADYPNAAQIQLWDRMFVRASRALDPLLGYRLGKTVIAVWRKPPAGTGR